MKQSFNHTYLGKDLIYRLKSRDQGAIKELYSKYSAILYGVILRIVGDRLTAEEVLQECFSKIWVSFPQYQGGESRLLTWLLAIARPLAIDKISSSHLFQNSKSHALDQVKEKSLGVAKAEQIETEDPSSPLPGEYREVIDMLYFRGCTQTEAATALGISVDDLKLKIRQAFSLLSNSGSGSERQF